MAFEKAFKTDKALVAHFDSFINALFNGEAPCELLNPKTNKKQFLKFFAGVEYESFDDFERSLKSHTKRANKKEKLDEFVKTHSLEMYPHSSYSIFLHDMKKTYEEKHSSMSPKDLRALMTKDWGKMSDKAKQPFEASYTKQKDEFIEKVRDIDPEYVGLFDKSKAPKAAPRPYTLFVTEQMKEIRKEQPDISNKDVMKLAGQAWREMNDSRKQKYYEKCGVEMPATSRHHDDEDEKPKGKVSTTTQKKETSTSAKKPATSTTTPAKGKSTTTSTPVKKVVASESEVSDAEEVKVKPVKGKSVPAKKVVTSESETSDVETKPVKKIQKPAAAGKKTKTVDDVLDNSDHTESDA